MFSAALFFLEAYREGGVGDESNVERLGHDGELHHGGSGFCFLVGDPKGSLNILNIGNTYLVSAGGAVP